jgi:hypothetical protein
MRKLTLQQKKSLGKRVQEERMRQDSEDVEAARKRFYTDYNVVTATKKAGLLAEQAKSSCAASQRLAETGHLTGQWRDEWFQWHDDNPGVAALKAEAFKQYQAWLEERGDSAYERNCKRKEQQLQRKSRQTAKDRIEVVDRNYKSEQRRKRNAVEWGPGYKPGDLVETPGGMVGIIIEHRDSAYGLTSSYIRVMVDGMERSFKTIKVTPI